MGTGSIRSIEVSTFGYFLARRAGTGEWGGGKGAAQGVGSLPIGARLPGFSAPKCPKAAIPIALEDKSSVFLVEEDKPHDNGNDHDERDDQRRTRAPAGTVLPRREDGLATRWSREITV